MNLYGSLLSCTLCMLVSTQGFSADEYPSKPIRIIVPFPAGASADVRARQLTPHLTEQLKQPIIIDNRPGAGANIGTALGAKSPPDGYTITLIAATTVGLNPHMYRNSGFDPLKDFVPLIVSMTTAGILTVNADSAIHSTQDLIAQAKAHPGKLTYGTSGPGSPQHLMGERFKKMAGVDIVHIPYKGDAPTLTDLMGGQIDMAFGSPPATIPLIESGKLRALAVTSPKKLAILPNVPTIAESGVAGYDETIWIGYAVPSGTPAPIIKKLHEAFRAAMLTPEYQRFVSQVGAELVAGTQEEAVQSMKNAYERYGRIVKELDLKVE